MREQLQKQMNEVGAELDVLRKERDALLAPPETEAELRSQQKAFHRWADAAIAGMEDASIEEKRQALYWLGVEVRVWRTPEKQLDYELVLTWRGLNAGRPLVLQERNTVPSVCTVKV